MASVEYWNARSAMAGVGREQRRIWSGLRDMGRPESYLRGLFAERNWRNVPGPFYGAETDTCGCGPPAAPDNVLRDEMGQEFVWRQPRSVDELRAVLDAVCQDPFNGYGADGDDHWTPELVIDWWERRERVFDWLESARTGESDETITRALAEFNAYLRGALHDDLQRYADWLSKR